MGVGSSFLSELPEGGLDELIKELDKKAKRISKKRTKATVVQSIEQPDGKVLEKRSDGSQRRVSPDGTTVETFKDGSVLKKTSNIVLCKFEDGSMLQISDSGDIIQKDKDGTQLQLLEDKMLLIVAHHDGRHVQWDLGSKTGTEDRPDGSKMEWNEEAGNRVELLVDGTVITTYIDGCVITKSPDGTLEQRNPDGTRIVSYPDGRRIQYNADGSRIEFFPDGSRVDYRADGVVIKQGSAAKGKSVNNGVDWDAAAAAKAKAAKGGGGGAKGDDDFEDDDFEDDSDNEETEVGSNDATAAASFLVRGAKFKDPKSLTKLETKIFKEALSVIPYEMGLDVTSKDVHITAEPAGKDTMKITFRMRLSGGECDAEMAEEVFEELEESLMEKGGTIFANSLARTAKELHYARMLTDSFAVSYSSADRKLDMPASWKPSGAVHEGDETGAAAKLAAIVDAAGGKGGSGSSSSSSKKLKQKLARVSKFKMLQGSIKIKGVTGSDFDRSNHHNNALRKGLGDIFVVLGLNESNLRIKLTNVLDVVRKDAVPMASVDYHVTLRGNAMEQAPSVVASLKKVFGDSSERKKFLSSYWSRIPAEVGVSPQVSRRQSHSAPQPATSPIAAQTSSGRNLRLVAEEGDTSTSNGGGNIERRNSNSSVSDKKDKKKRDKKARSAAESPSNSESDNGASPTRGGGNQHQQHKSLERKLSSKLSMGSLAQSVLAKGGGDDDGGGGKRLLPSLTMR